MPVSNRNGDDDGDDDDDRESALWGGLRQDGATAKLSGERGAARIVPHARPRRDDAVESDPPPRDAVGKEAGRPHTYLVLKLIGSIHLHTIQHKTRRGFFCLGLRSL